MGFFERFRTRKRHREIANKLYLATVTQSRSPRLYVDFGVPDTVDGRFDMIILHVMLLIRRLRGEGAEAANISQEVLNLMFADMDRNFREMGISDISIGKHVKKTAKAFYGRADVLERGLESGALDLSGALRETVLRSADNSDEQTSAFASYIQAVDLALKNQTLSGLIDGEVSFENTSNIENPA